MIDLNRINKEEDYVNHFHAKFLWKNSDGDRVYECDCGQTVIVKEHLSENVK